MAKDPAFLFYTSDFLTGTMTMTNEQVGKYIRLLCLQHQKGVIPEKDMIFICGSSVEDNSDIYSKFKKNGVGFYNERLRIEVEKRAAYSASRSANRLKGKEKGYKKEENHMNNICQSYDVHMENEDEDVNENINKDVKTVPFQEIVKLYHETLPVLPQVLKLSDKRKTQIKARWYETDKTQSLEWWKDFFDLISQSKFLTGNNDRGWKPDLEWITKQENFLKICEGKYNHM